MSGAGDDRAAQRPVSPLTGTPKPPAPRPVEEPPDTFAGRETEWVADHDTQTRDMTPAVGVPGAPGAWPPRSGEPVALQREGWADAQWSYLFGEDTSYAATEPAPGQVAAANRRMRSEVDMPEVVGPILKAPVWTWEVPLYFWFGGMAAGSSFVALACDLAGDHRSAATARKVAMAAVVPCPPLLIADLGRPARFLNMLRIFKPRSPMSTGAWSLMAFSTLGAGAVAADLVHLKLVARVLGGANAIVGGYLGSYTGVLLGCTAVPLWARSRTFLPPIFIATGAATGAAACRLTLVAQGLPADHPTRTALGWVESGAMLTELGLSTLNERRLGRVGSTLEAGRPGQLFRVAKWSVRTGLALRFARPYTGPWIHHVASALYLLAAGCFRYAWVGAGRTSALDHEAVARTARGDVTGDDPMRGAENTRRTPSRLKHPLRVPVVGRRVWTEAIRRTSLAAERVLGVPKPHGPADPQTTRSAPE